MERRSGAVIMVYINNRVVAAVNIPDFFLDAFDDLRVAIFKFVGNYNIKNQVCMSGAGYNAEVVERKPGIYIQQYFFHTFFHGEGFGVIGAYGVHMDNRFALQPAVQLMFDIID